MNYIAPVINRRSFLTTAAVVGAILVGSVGTARADVNAPWRTAEGRALIEEWINLAMNRLNSSNLAPEYNGRKPWFINQYGLLNARGIYSNYEPDFWPRYEGRLHIVWVTYNRNSFTGRWDNSFDFFNRANPAIPSVQDYVRSRLRTSPTPPAPANMLVGRWAWFTNGDVEFFSNGTFRQARAGLSGRYDMVGNRLVMEWNHGFTDVLTLSFDGLFLEGRGHPGNHRVWGRKL